MSEGIESLREHLFETLAALKNKDDPMDIDRAKAVSDVAGRLIDSAKVEVDFVKATGAEYGSGFLESDRKGNPKLRQIR